jgi:hypothetical protein
MRKTKPDEVTHEGRRSEINVAAAASATSPSEAIEAFDGALAGTNRDKKFVAKIKPFIKLAEQNADDPHSRKIGSALRNLRRVLRAWDKFAATHRSR